MNDEGILYIVSTPIGNLQDITFRAVEIMKHSNIVFAEDTRNSRKLLSFYDIQTPLKSFHSFNEHQKKEQIIAQLKEGKNIAQIADAGTPGISDPGYLLIKNALENNIKVEVIPGATALLPALLKSGFPCDRFIFEGFLPHKKKKKKRIEAWIDEEKTVIIYESPHRLIKTLEMMRDILGERKISISRELTKKFEETITDNIESVLNHFENNPIKGEFVIVLAGKNDRIDE